MGGPSWIRTRAEGGKEEGFQLVTRAKWAWRQVGDNSPSTTRGIWRARHDMAGGLLFPRYAWSSLLGRLGPTSGGGRERIECRMTIPAGIASDPLPRTSMRSVGSLRMSWTEAMGHTFAESTPERSGKSNPRGDSNRSIARTIGLLPRTSSESGYARRIPTRTALPQTPICRFKKCPGSPSVPRKQTGWWNDFERAVSTSGLEESPRACRVTGSTSSLIQRTSPLRFVLQP